MNTQFRENYEWKNAKGSITLQTCRTTQNEMERRLIFEVRTGNRQNFESGVEEEKEWF